MEVPPYIIQHLEGAMEDYQHGVMSGMNDNVERLSGQKPMTVLRICQGASGSTEPARCAHTSCFNTSQTRIHLMEINMKVMAIGTLQTLSPEQRKRFLPDEVPATLQLYLDGKMEQFWLRDNGAGVIFLMSTDSVAEADGLLKALPLGRAKLLNFELLPIGPLLPLGMLVRNQ